MNLFELYLECAQHIYIKLRIHSVENFQRLFKKWRRIRILEFKFIRIKRMFLSGNSGDLDEQLEFLLYSKWSRVYSA
jgi:hypothetical protein